MTKAGQECIYSTSLHLNFMIEQVMDKKAN